MLLRFTSLCLGFLMVAMLVLGSAKQVSAQDDYVIRPGDTLQIEVLEDSNLNRNVLVLPDGTFSFPMAGTVSVKGRSVEQVRQSLSSVLTPSFAAAPNVYVSVSSLVQERPTRSGSSSSRLMDVYALGQFEAPGRKEVKPGTTLLQFLAEGGGLSRFAAEKRIELHRTDRKTGAVTTYLFNYRTPAGGTSGINGGTVLSPGDVVKIPQRRLFE